LDVIPPPISRSIASKPVIIMSVSFPQIDQEKRVNVKVRLF
jgi:hypothetical protein